MSKRVSATSEQTNNKEELKKPLVKPERWSVKNWILFINERAPPLVFLLLAVLPTASGLKLCEGWVDYEKLAWGTTAHLILLITLRIMDDVKDYEKDKICHPDRPLPRGFMAYDEVCTVLNMIPLLMFGLAGGLFWRYNVVVASSYVFCVFYLYAMYVEFGIGEILEPSPLIYAITHQVLVYFITVFVVTLGGLKWNDAMVLKLGSVALSGFFTYEVCRKLDPTHLKIKGTYLIIYGRVKTFIITVVLVAIGAYSSYILGCHNITWYIEAILIISLLALFLYMPSEYPVNTKPKIHKPVEAIAILYVLIHFIAPFISAFLK